MSNKYGIGDYIRVGSTRHLYFKVIAIDNNVLIVTRVPKGKQLRIPIELTESSNTTIIKSNLTEVVLYGK